MKKEIYYLQSTAMTVAELYMSKGYSVSFYRDMQDGKRVWIVEWKP